MKAAIFNGPGQFNLLERAIPKPSAGEVLLQVRRVGVCGTDLLIFKGAMPERVQPGRILGHEMVAVISESAHNAEFKPGDRVVVEPTVFCNHCQACHRGLTHVCEQLRFLGIDQDGALQQFWTVPAHRLHRVPDSISDDHAAMVEPLAVAVHDVRLAGVRENETVIIIGAGTIGLLIAHLIRKTGAKLMLLEINPYRVEFARSRGFQVCSPDEQEIDEAVANFTQGAGADVVFEASGSVEGARLMTSLAAVRGRIMIVGIQGRQVPVDLFQVFYRELSLQGARAYSTEDFQAAIRTMATGEIDLTPFISRRFPLEEIQAALEIGRSGAPVMKILIDFTAAA